MRRSPWVAVLRNTLLVLPAALVGCTGLPSGVRPVQEFDLDRYLGTWYEIARLDHRFERGLTDVSATYTLRDDGGVEVLNRGCDAKTDRWKQTKGKAYFVGEPTTGHLKVSFFGPIFSSYAVIALDQEQYDYALVCGASRSYLWILARRTTLSQPIVEALLAQARELGFATNELIFVEQTRTDR